MLVCSMSRFVCTLLVVLLLFNNIATLLFIPLERTNLFLRPFPMTVSRVMTTNEAKQRIV